MKIGAHLSISGGLHNAIGEARRLGFGAVQIFTKNQRQWKAPALGEGAVRDFRNAVEESGIGAVVAHNTYLVNLATPDPEIRRKSIAAMEEEAARAHRLGIPVLVMHPGSHKGAGAGAGADLIVSALDGIFSRNPGLGVKIALETTAGQGRDVGGEFGRIGEIVSRVSRPELMAVCFDTCHVFAAGYDIRTAASYGAVMKEFDAKIGLERIAVFHMNDALHPLGSRKDRHEHIGKGAIGLEGFRLIMRDRRFANVPKILETPKVCAGVEMDPVNFETLMRLKKIDKPV